MAKLKVIEFQLNLFNNFFFNLIYFFFSLDIILYVLFVNFRTILANSQLISLL